MDTLNICYAFYFLELFRLTPMEYEYDATFLMEQFRLTHDVRENFMCGYRFVNQTDQWIGKTITIAEINSKFPLLPSIMITIFRAVIRRPLLDATGKRDGAAYFNEAYNLCLGIEGAFRCIEMGRSFYLLYTNPPGIDRRFLKLKILLNIIKIARLAIQHLNPLGKTTPYVVIALRLLDSMARIADLSLYFDIDLLIRSLGQGINHTLLLSSFKRISNKFFPASSITPIEVFAFGALFGGLIWAIKRATHEIFNSFQTQQNTYRDLAEWAVTLVSSTLLAANFMVIFRISPSVTKSFYSIGKMSLHLGALLGICAVVGKTYLLATRKSPIFSWNELMQMSVLAAIVVATEKAL